MFRKLKWQIAGELLAARYNWCQGPVPGRGLAVEKHWSKPKENRAGHGHRLACVDIQFCWYVSAFQMNLPNSNPDYGSSRLLWNVNIQAYLLGHMTTHPKSFFFLISHPEDYQISQKYAFKISFTLRSHGSSVGAMTRKRDRQSRNRVLNSDRGKRFFSSLKCVDWL